MRSRTKLVESRPAKGCLFALCNHSLGCVDVALKSTPLKPQNYVVCTPYRYVPRVPQEIIDLIVDNIEEMASFHACSLVCWAFVPACRKRIFRDVCFGMASDAPNRLHEILLRSPRIALYIEDVTIHRPHDPNFWIPAGSPLPTLLSMLPNISRFSLFGCWGDWLHVPPAFAAAILRVISSGKLDRLHVLTVANAPAVFLRSALSLRVVSFFYVGWDPAEKTHRLPQAPSEVAAPVGPEFLNLSLDTKLGRVLDFMQAFGSNYFANVRRLAVNPIPNSANSAQNFARVLSAVQSTLERLEIQWHERMWTPPSFFHLCSLIWSFSKPERARR
ncbi:hypothetical protein K438DRAFT_16315 [Mycena galopus ATCC 62051]|nr:hypothetical protein K438DRAFT_16315 [Mycena galopus ATCC 62051]